MYIYARESREWERDVEEKSITDRRLRCLNDLLLSSMDRSSFRARLQWLFLMHTFLLLLRFFFCVIAIFSYSTESRRWKTCKFDRRVLLLNSQRALYTVWLLEWIPILKYLRMSFHFVVFDRQTSNHTFCAKLANSPTMMITSLATSRQRNLRKYKKRGKSDSPRFFRVLIEIINHIWSNSNLFARKHSGEEDEEEKNIQKLSSPAPDDCWVLSTEFDHRLAQSACHSCAHNWSSRCYCCCCSVESIPNISRRALADDATMELPKHERELCEIKGQVAVNRLQLTTLASCRCLPHLKELCSANLYT